jgi:hypothetical protein
MILARGKAMGQSFMLKLIDRVIDALKQLGEAIAGLGEPPPVLRPIRVPVRRR